jgi:hypothetical protein
MEPDVFVRWTPGVGGPEKVVCCRDGGPGMYGVEDVDCGAKELCSGLLYCGMWSWMAAAFNPVPSVASGGGGVFSRCAMGSGAAGAAGL